MRLVSRLAFGLVLLLPLRGHAQGVTPESAQSLQAQLHGWMAGMAGPKANLNPRITAEGDHYHLALPIPGLVGEEAASAQLIPLENGRWRLRAIQVPPEMHFNLHLPEPGTPSGMVSTAVSVTIGAQDSHAVFDPSLNSRSELDIGLHDFTLRSEGPNQHSLQHIGEYRVTSSLQPAASGGLDFDQTALVTGWSSSSQITGKPAATFGAQRVAMKGRIAGLNREQAGVLLSSVSGLIATLPAKEAAEGGKTQLNPAQRTALRRFVESLRGIVTSMQAEEDIDGLHVTLAGMGRATVRHMHFGFGGNAPDGLLRGWVEIALDGLSIPTLPPEAAGLVPQHVVLRPSLAGVPADAVMRLALDATQPGTNQAMLAAEATSLVRKGTTVALEKLGFDIGPAVVRGTGHVTVVGPDEYAGAAQLSATGFDALMQKAQQDPALQRELPILIMLRGYAKPEGERLVWNVVAAGGGLTINGMPLIQPHSAEARHGGMPPTHQK